MKSKDPKHLQSYVTVEHILKDLNFGLLSCGISLCHIKSHKPFY